jgi:hypothetical protein
MLLGICPACSVANILGGACSETLQHNPLPHGVLLIVMHIYIEGVTERCRQMLGTSSTYENKKKCPHQHVSRNI